MLRPEDLRNEQYFVNEDTEFAQERYDIACMFLPPYPDLTVEIPEDIQDSIYETWQEILEDYQIDHEWRYTYQCEEDIKSNQDVWEDSIESLRRARRNAEQWIDKARDEFQKEFDFLTFGIANKEVYSKHYKNPKWDTEKVTRKSSSKAVLNQDLTDSELTRIYQEVICANLEYFLDTDELLSYDFAVDINSPTGHSRGQMCSKLLYKVDRTTKMFHPYPITDSEAQKKVILVHERLS